MEEQPPQYDLTSVPELIQKMLNQEEQVTPLLTMIESKLNEEKYCVIRYNKKELSSETIPTYGLCRSLIMNSNNKLISFAPPKSISTETFLNKNANDHHLVIAEEFVEGTMINVFYNKGWEISTRSKVGGETRFFKETQGKTFRTLFFEACSSCQLDLDSLNKELCYSFVLQHPENRIVVPFQTPCLYLVAAYKIDHNNFKVTDMMMASDLGLSGTTVKFPTIYKYENFEEIVDKYASVNTPYEIVGVVLRHRLTGERTKIRNPVYEHVKQLRGNQPKMQYHYLCLRKERKVEEFLRYFPEYNEEFVQFRNQIHLFLSTLYSNYVSCYIKREKPLGEFPGQYKTHMFNIHKLYVERKERIKINVVEEYVNNLHPSLFMFSLNYHLR